MLNSKVILIILDGWGIAEDPTVSAIDKANLPFYRYLIKNYPFTQLKACGNAVGLPEGQMGNSEVGHITIGAGRIVYQDLERISRAIANGALEKNPAFERLLSYCNNNNRPLHIMGLVSEGGVHSSLNHLIGIIDLLQKAQFSQDIYFHVFTDGRDTAPTSALGFVETLEHQLSKLPRARIASLIGRYYAMDRDKRWERTLKAYNLLTRAEGQKFETTKQAILASYAAGITDEFIEPCIIEPPAIIQPGDAVLNFNFRTDRNRQISYALSQGPIPEYGMQPLPLFYVTMNRYDKTFQGIEVLFDREQVIESLGEILSLNGKSQIRIAETEKYPHVTFFFNGGRELPFEGEERILCPSPKVPTYDMKPEMSIREIVQSILPKIEKSAADFIVINFANPDMVGHTGQMQATILACEAVDRALAEIIPKALQANYCVLVTADHGNADKMLQPDGSPHTAHTLAPVPFIYVAQNAAQVSLSEGGLSDIAPTILGLMNLPIPSSMSGKSLILHPAFVLR
ncbi:MAG: 2,3-bisphosphoglycerate-independent phosphoglycerate mutase [Bacteroidia bacterium]|nr:2,3-bisphosphoglycerate-independent phosphoglycerate mutase [Bacteroidia bacterium]MDW8159197.1 2,3-bisphosphoglycerate-independent phosphoglycerate mutase [Bacteroidia bacterium]